MKIFRLACLSLPLLAASTAFSHDIKGERFHYDPVDRLVEGRLLEDPLRYEPSLAKTGEGGALLALLDFTPGEGDRIVAVSLDAEGAPVEERVVVDEPGKYRRPTVTIDAEDRRWVSYEAEQKGTWSVFVRPVDRGDGEPERAGPAGRNAINHAVAPLPGGGLLLAWQEDRGGQWDVVARRRAAGGEWGDPEVLSAGNGLGDWHPAVAVRGSERFVAWDAYDGASFSVRGKRGDGEGWGETIRLTDSAAFEGRPSVAFDGEGTLYVAWEEGAPNWGKDFRRFLPDPPEFDDERGGLHRYRLVRLAKVADDGSTTAIPVPMPSLEAAAEREGARPNTDRLGLYYERPRLAVDGRDRLWLLHRHYYFPEVARADRPTSHIEEGWRLYARCLEDGKWSVPVGLEPTQRDGMQRLSLAPGNGGLLAAWTVGRTHRGKESPGRGIALAEVVLPAGAAFREVTRSPAVHPEPSGGPGKRQPAMAPETVGDTEYRVYFGDLHRHTDLSLCRVYFDGSIDDAYRYATEAAELDFLGITDHARDLGNGDVRSQIWWRSLKEVARHRLGDTFFPLVAYERSHGETDHNVVTLREDMLRPHNPPLKEFWKEIGSDTITIPHNPIRPLRAFAYHDDEKRPLLEIYQACRANPMTREAHDGLRRGYHMGFIASSDHLATHTSYACVWSPAGGEEPIFRSLQARRTYGATAKIRLVFRTGGHWMGERVAVDAMPTFHYEVEGEGELDRVEIVRDGEVAETLENEGGGTSMAGSFRGPGEVEPGAWIYIHAVQRDGEEAWSSPIWLE